MQLRARPLSINTLDTSTTTITTTKFYHDRTATLTKDHEEHEPFRLEIAPPPAFALEGLTFTVLPVLPRELTDLTPAPRPLQLQGHWPGANPSLVMPMPFGLNQIVLPQQPRPTVLVPAARTSAVVTAAEKERRRREAALKADTACEEYYTNKGRKVEQTMYQVYLHWNGWTSEDADMQGWPESIARGLSITRLRMPLLFQKNPNYYLRHQAVQQILRLTMSQRNLRMDEACTWLESRRRASQDTQLLIGKWIAPVLRELNLTESAFKALMRSKRAPKK